MRLPWMSVLSVAGLLLASPALAGNWGENWGSMIWGSAAAVPSLEGVGVWLLVISLFGAAAWRLRRRSIHASLTLVLLPLLPLLMARHYTNWHAFTNGSVADADDVNENFETLESEIEFVKSELALLRLGEVLSNNFLGSCVIRNNSSSLNSHTDPLIGDGFAKTMVNLGPNMSIGNLQGTCTDAVFDVLLTEYCKYNTESVVRQVVVYDEITGNFESSEVSFQKFFSRNVLVFSRKGVAKARKILPAQPWGCAPI